MSEENELKQRKGAAGAEEAKSPEKKKPEAETVRAEPVSSPSGSLTPFYMVCLVVLALVYQYVEGTAQSMQQSEARNWDPAPKNMAKNEVTILYCSSWAYEGTFRQVYQLINQRAEGELDVSGGHFPVPPSKLFLAQALQFFQVFVFAMLFGAEALFGALGLPTPQPFAALADNKMMSFLLVWMVGNVGQSVFTNTGAFEIYHSNDLIWSSLQVGRLPNYPELVEAFKTKGVSFQ